ncbi:Cullin-3 [Mactra antiquata]
MCLNFTWTDFFAPCLKEWNGTTLNRLSIDADLIWLPDIRIGTPTDFGMPIEDEIYGHVNIYRDGKIQGWPYMDKDIPFIPDIKYYPFDTQEISIGIYPWTDSIDELHLVHDNGIDSLSAFQENSEWDIINHTITSETYSWENAESYSRIRFEFVIRRRWLYPAISMLLPVVVTSGLNCLVFILPVESGERITLNISVFLTLAVFLTIINDSLPKNSNGVSILVLYLLLQMIGSVLSIAFTCLAVNVYFTKNYGHPTWKHRVLSKLCCSGQGIEVDMLEPSVMQDSEQKHTSPTSGLNLDCKTLSRKFDTLFFWLSVVWNTILFLIITTAVITQT